MNFKIFLNLTLVLHLFFTPLAFADEAADAWNASETIIDLAGDKKYSKVWDSYMSDLFKSTMTED